MREKESERERMRERKKVIVRECEHESMRVCESEIEECERDRGV